MRRRSRGHFLGLRVDLGVAIERRLEIVGGDVVDGHCDRILRNCWEGLLVGKGWGWEERLVESHLIVVYYCDH